MKSLAKKLLGIDLLEVKVAMERELKRELEIDVDIELFESEIRKKMREQEDAQIIVG